MNEDMAAGSHPDDVKLDLLRAGLLDETAEEKASIQHHLQGCGVCRGRMARWKWIAENGTPRNELLSRQLQERRRRALGGRRSARAQHRAMARMAIAGVAAALILALGTVLNLQLWRTKAPLPDVARAESVPDLYSHIDFYLWVSREGAPDSSHENQS
ncbi:MAG: hypothetical protein ACYDHY_10400 [Acidiferrobacterales bacterium]